MSLKKRLKAFLHLVSPWKRKIKIDISRYECDFELMSIYKFEDIERGSSLRYVGRRRFININGDEERIPSEKDHVLEDSNSLTISFKDHSGIEHKQTVKKDYSNLGTE